MSVITPSQPLGMAFLFWSADLSQAERLATPFVMAQAALSLELPVELHFSAQTVQLLTPQAQSTLVGFGSERRSLGAYIQEVHALGATLWACSQSLHAAQLHPEALVAQCQGLSGAVAFMARASDPQWRTLVF